MKKVILSLVVVGISCSLYAEEMGTAIVNGLVQVVEKKIDADKDVAIQKKAKVTVDGGSTIEAKSKMGKDNVVVGAVGTVVAVGEEVEISGSTIKAESEMDSDNVVVGTAGTVVLGAH